MVLTLVLTLLMMVGLFLLLFSVVVFIKDKRFFKPAPKDVYEAINEHKDAKKGIGYALAFLALILLIGSLFYGAYDGIKNDFSYLDFIIRFLIMLYGLEIFDIVVLDFIIFHHTHFYQHFYPETINCVGYKKIGYNYKTHLIFIFCILPLCAALSGICLVIKTSASLNEVTTTLNMFLSFFVK